MLQLMKIADIVPSPTNPRKAISRDDIEYEQIKNSLDRFGYVEPLVVNSVNNHCVSGNHRIGVLSDMGVTEVLCVIINEPDENREIALTIALNKIKGKWDYNKLGDVLKSVDYDDIEVTGFYGDELERLLGEIESYVPEDNRDDDDESDYEDDEPFETTINAKIGSYSFKVYETDYVDMINGIRVAKGFDNKAIVAELKRRLRQK